MRIIILLFTAIITLGSCKNDPGNSNNAMESTSPQLERKPLSVPAFSADSAYLYLNKQLEFGPRIPNTNAHVETKDWLVTQLKKFTDKVNVQEFTANRFDRTKLNGYNIIGSVNPDQSRRVLLLAHWDTRFIADHAIDPANEGKGVMGADDGASGVAVLLEIARILKENPIDVGVDFLLTDLEDQGKSNDPDGVSWCLGAQYWAKNPHKSAYNANFGILLDMVGAKGAKFKKEQISLNYAPEILRYVWQLANSMGYGQYFINEKLSGGVVDDHMFINRIIGIPTIDIINKPTNNSFGDHWHTENDNIDIIDKSVLRAVGQVVTAVVYRFDANYL
ncbi:M28 family peptidase [Membranihabitans maritimus]|uniref:M28 family peptidase n=1 Tax=Membranihabitans maritimus TaxID=2904244 RepID=UPI001F1F8E4B|nr:M28 family peptidase [Membranihabitans maritimus]